MHFETTAVLVAFFGLSAAVPTGPKNALPRRSLRGREVPQEHSHEPVIVGCNAFLKTPNTANIQDCIFGLLGNAAASVGQGSITNTDCLHKATADQAFTNAKAAGSVDGMTNALIYASLERNTGQVGLKSVVCTDPAANPEVEAIVQHQDPASDNAAAENKANTLILAQQIASIGGDPQRALEAGTFAPGQIGDPTAKGNTCDDANDAAGCINSQNLLVPDATAAEIDAAVAGTASAGAAGQAAGNNNAAAGNDSAAAANASVTTTAAAAADSTCAAPVTSTITVASEAAAATATAAPAADTGATGAASSAAAPPGNADAAAAGNNNAATGTNVQTFTGSLGGAAPPVESSAGARPFSVGGDTFVNAGAALQRSCDKQKNACFNAANSGQLAKGSQAQCEQQQKDCNAAAQAGAAKLRLRSLQLHRRQSRDFGSCDAPTLTFGPGNDGRKEDSFAIQQPSDFQHGSALGINVLTSFICQQLQDKCKASAATIEDCQSGAAAAASLKGQAAAAAFNNAL